MFETMDLEQLNLKTTKTDQRTLSLLSSEINECDFVIAGFADDEGIQNNSGRPGARLGPNKIREFLYKMTPPLFSPENLSKKIYDLGNLKNQGSLAERHDAGVKYLSRILDQNKTLISFGGGHDYGYVDGQSFLNFCSDQTLKPIIFNFDAHLDLRPVLHNISSGTPFYRLLQNESFDFFEVGIQEHCNSKEHLEWLKNKGGHCLSLNELYSSNEGPYSTHFNFDFFKEKIKDYATNRPPCYISVDIDAFSNAFAPGCSQSFATGLEPQGFFKAFNYLLENFDVKVLGIYEVSPSLDLDDHTSKLAAQIAYKFIYK